MPVNDNRRTNTNPGLWFDLHFILASVRRWLFVSICMAIICGITAYIAIDYLKSDTYTAEVVVAVTSRANDNDSWNDYNLDNALSRNVNMWKSDMLLNQIKKANPEKEDIDGWLNAESIAGSNLVKVTCTAKSAKDAYSLLHDALQNYKQVAPSFDSAFYTVVLSTVDADAIQVKHVKTWLFGALGCIGALAACLGMVVLWSLFTDVIHEEEQAKHLLDVPLLETLVHARRSRKNRYVLLNQKNLPLDYLEAIDLMTSRIEHRMHQKNEKILLVTSVMENEGKSSVACNLAMNLCRRGRRVLLVDLDLRRPNLWKKLPREKDKAVNLSTLLRKEEQLEKAIEVLPECWDLNIIRQFMSVKDADSFLENTSIAEQMLRLSENYDYVILDMPPVGQVRDADVAARFADVTLMVVRQDFCRASVVNDITDQMEENGAPCIGIVLNNCRGRRRRAKARYGYGSSYHRRKGEVL